MFEQLKLDDYTRTHIQVTMIHLSTANSFYVQREAKERVEHARARVVDCSLQSLARVFCPLLSSESTRSLIIFCQIIPYFVIISSRF